MWILDKSVKDRPTAQRTDTPSYRDASASKKPPSPYHSDIFDGSKFFEGLPQLVLVDAGTVDDEETRMRNLVLISASTAGSWSE